MISKNNIAKSDNPGSFAHKLLLGLLALVAVLASVHLLFQYLNLNVYNELNGRIFEFSNRVDFDDEASIPTWISQLLLLGIGMAAFLVSRLERARPARIIWSIVAGIGVLLSLDEVAALHELTLQTIHLLVFNESAPTLFANAWFIVLPVVALGAGLLAWQMFKHVPARTMRILVFGGIVYVFGAVVIDVITNSSLDNTFKNKGVLVAIEETLELVGTTLVLYGIVDYLERSYGKKLKTAYAQLMK